MVSDPVTSALNALRFCDYPFTCQYNKENKKAEGFKIPHCHWSFSSDILAVKGLRQKEYAFDKFVL